MCFNFAIWEMRNYKSVLLNNIAVFSGLLPVHTCCCYWSTCCLYAHLSGFLAQPVRKSLVLVTNNTMTVNLTKFLNLLGLGRGFGQWRSGYDAGVADNCRWQFLFGSKCRQDHWGLMDNFRWCLNNYLGNGQLEILMGYWETVCIGSGRRHLNFHLHSLRVSLVFGR